MVRRVRVFERAVMSGPQSERPPVATQRTGSGGSSSSVAHPPRAVLHQFALGLLAPGESRFVEAHLEQCDLCAAELSEAPTDTLLEVARAASAKTRLAGLPDLAPGDSTEIPIVPPELANHPRYRVVEPLGSGGMGTVYRAEHRLMERPVALKVIRRRLVAHPTAIERFLREVRAAARLSHPNIVASFDAEQAGDLRFLVMEYVEGDSLDRLVSTPRSLSVAEACEIIRQAALGLAHAHSRGMIHRDIKPQNIMLTPSGQVKVLDFGLARLADLTADESAPTSTSDNPSPSDETVRGAAAGTMAGMILGTPDYLAPEQALNAAAADERSDLYSLGCTFYFLLTGHPPFPEGTGPEKLVAHCQSPIPDPRRERPEIPADVAAIVLRLLAKSPADRFAAAADVAEALRPFCDTRSSRETTTDRLPVDAAVSRHTESTRPDPRPAAASAPTDGRRFSRRAVVGLGVCLAVGGVAAFSKWIPGLSPPARNRRLLFVVPQYKFWYSDYGPVRTALERRGHAVVTAGPEEGDCFPMPEDKQSPQPPRVTIERAVDASLTADGYDGVLFCGFGVYPFLDGTTGEETRRLLDEFRREKKVVAAMCTGQAVLLEYGLLDGIEAAGGEYLRASYPDKRQKGTIWRDEPVVVAGDGRIITASDASAAEPFVAAIDEALRKQ